MSLSTESVQLTQQEIRAQMIADQTRRVDAIYEVLLPQIKTAVVACTNPPLFWRPGHVDGDNVDINDAMFRIVTYLRNQDRFVQTVVVDGQAMLKIF